MYVKTSEVIVEGLKKHAEEYVIFSVSMDDLASHACDIEVSPGINLMESLYDVASTVEAIQKIQSALTVAFLNTLLLMGGKT